MNAVFAQAPTPREYLLPDVDDVLATLPLYPDDTSFGTDIDECQRVLLDPRVAVAEKERLFRQWASRFQPCMLGRLGARERAGVAFDLCWIDRALLARGSLQVTAAIQRARRDWKERARLGLSSGLLIMFNAPELARARPGLELLEACRWLCGLYLVEHAPLAVDTIYTEALPLGSAEGRTLLFKGGINTFYPGSHRTRNHDRRVPGGLLISVNSPGHLAHSLCTRGLESSLPAAVQTVQDLALRSIGNGGIGHEHSPTTSWHNLEAERTGGCPMAHRPRYVPERFSTLRYSALYHTDVLLPSAVTCDARRDLAHDQVEQWNHLRIDYFRTEPVDASREDYGMFDGHPIRPEAVYHNPWPPVHAVNSPLADY